MGLRYHALGITTASMVHCTLAPTLCNSAPYFVCKYLSVCWGYPETRQVPDRFVLPRESDEEKSDGHGMAEIHRQHQSNSGFQRPFHPRVRRALDDNVQRRGLHEHRQHQHLVVQYSQLEKAQAVGDIYQRSTALRKTAHTKSGPRQLRVAVRVVVQQFTRLLQTTASPGSSQAVHSHQLLLPMYFNRKAVHRPSKMLE